MAPEHPLVDELTDPERSGPTSSDVRRGPPGHRDRAERGRSTRGRAPRSGGPSRAATSVNPFTGQPVPVYVADYVLMGYGTGAIMAVPAEDERDFAFATVYGLDVVRTVEPPEGFEEAGGGAWTGEGPKINCGFLNGMAVGPANAAAIACLEAQAAGFGPSTTGSATGSSHGSGSGAVPSLSCTARTTASCRFPRIELPVLAPDDVEFLPTGQSPLAPHARVPAHDVSALRRPGRAARPTPWTPSSTRAGTSCASAIRSARTAPSIPLPPGVGCR